LVSLNKLVSPVPGTEFKLGLDWKEVKREPDDILDLAEKIGTENDMKFELKT
jgi:hypothetical protein